MSRTAGINRSLSHPTFASCNPRARRDERFATLLKLGSKILMVESSRKIQ